VVGNITGFANDVATLVELQAKLAAMDFNECVTRAGGPLKLSLGGAVIMLGAVPVVLAGLGLLLADALHLSNGLALLIVGVGALIVAGVITAIAGPRISRSFESFRRTREEFERNLRWVKTVLIYSGRPASPRRY